MSLYAITVTGPVRGEDLGITLPDEHVHCDLRLYCTNGKASATPVHLVPRDRLQQAPLDFLDNLDMRDEKVAEAELDLFSKSGGRTLVELTTTGLAPDLAVLGRVSVATGINIIAGTGYYIAATQPAGIIGEIGT